MEPDNDFDNRSTVSGPSRPEGAPANDFTAKLAATQELAAAMPYNVNKALEYGDVSLPEKGQTVEPPDPATTGSTLTENTRPKKPARVIRNWASMPAMSRLIGSGPIQAIGAHDQPRRSGRRQPEFVEGRISRSGLAGRFYSPRKDHAFRS